MPGEALRSRGLASTRLHVAASSRVLKRPPLLSQVWMEPGIPSKPGERDWLNMISNNTLTIPRCARMAMTDSEAIALNEV